MLEGIPEYRKKCAPASTSVAASWEPEKRTQLSCVWTPEPQNSAIANYYRIWYVKVKEEKVTTGKRGIWPQYASKRKNRMTKDQVLQRRVTGQARKQSSDEHEKGSQMGVIWTMSWLRKLQFHLFCFSQFDILCLPLRSNFGFHHIYYRKIEVQIFRYLFFLSQVTFL